METKEREWFIFYNSFWKAIKELPKENQLEIYNAIAEYSFTLQEPELVGLSKTIWILIKPQLEANNRRYINWTKPKIKQEKSKQEANEKQEKSKREGKEKEKEKEKDKEIKKEINLEEVKAYKNNKIILYLYEIIVSNYVKQSFNTKSFIELYDYIISKAKQFWFVDNYNWDFKIKEFLIELEKINNYYELKEIKNFKSTYLNWITKK